MEGSQQVAEYLHKTVVKDDTSSSSALSHGDCRSWTSVDFVRLALHLDARLNRSE